MIWTKIGSVYKTNVRLVTKKRQGEFPAAEYLKPKNQNRTTLKSKTDLKKVMSAEKHLSAAARRIRNNTRRKRKSAPINMRLFITRGWLVKRSVAAIAFYKATN
jgi:hypothetical protein